ncbi:MAG TPA: zf-HC2 domain-containing protein [Blastocatellia bacterium]|nr:zf-HC2 domain-containing protein [Blastocatellia bacterium]
MKCWRIDIRRRLASYLHNELKPARSASIERHLLDCSRCRTALLRLRTGSAFAQMLDQQKPERDRWEAIQTSIQSNAAGESRQAYRASRAWPLFSLLRRPALVPVAFAAVLALAGMLVLIARTSDRQLLRGMTLALDTGEFQPVSISGIEQSTKAHVVAEGYVSEVKINDEDGDLSFKLVENLDAREPFIICEIIDPIRLEPPQVGSRVRVYGVSRYDNQANHNWYEVHPVLNIELVRH